jgi:hypothetical protein
MYGVDKEEAAIAVINAGHRLIWTDDQFTPSSGELYDYLTRDGKALLIRPKDSGKRTGLRPEHLDLIDEFVKDA